MSLPRNHIEIQRAKPFVNQETGETLGFGGVFIDGVKVYVLEDGISIDMDDDQPIVTLKIIPETLICRGQ